MKLIRNKIKISEKVYRFIFAFLMSFVTSSTVSAMVILITGGLTDYFFELWFQSILRSWPIVLVLILIFVPLINKCLDTIFEKNND